MKKCANSCICGPTVRAVLDKRGVGQSAQIGPILTFQNIFLYKIKIQSIQQIIFGQNSQKGTQKMFSGNFEFWFQELCNEGKSF